MNQSLLMIFIKNPVRGKVKTRLAATIGDDRALKVYEQLLEHTRQIASFVKSDKAVFYSDFIDESDHWSKLGFMQHLQQGNDLGERMSNAFSSSFDKGYKRVIIIGSDCFELSDTIIEQGFEALNNKDAVIGPAADGGYYLLGMNEMHPSLFRGIKWSTAAVLSETIQELQKLKIATALLPVLSDVDEEKDLAAGLLTLGL